MPLSRDPVKRERQLANLQPGAGRWQPGAKPALRHGLRTRQPRPEEVEPVLGQVLEDLKPLVPEPLKDHAGEILPWARESVWALGVLKLGIVRCLRYLAQHGETDERGRWRKENDELRKATVSYRQALSEEAMTLRSRIRAGVDVARGVDIATALSEPDPHRRRLLMREAGVPLDEEPEQ